MMRSFVLKNDHAWLSCVWLIIMIINTAFHRNWVHSVLLFACMLHSPHCFYQQSVNQFRKQYIFRNRVIWSTLYIWEKTDFFLNLVCVWHLECIVQWFDAVSSGRGTEADTHGGLKRRSQHMCLFWRRGWWVGFGKLSYKQVRTPRSINPAANCFDQFVV